MTRLTDLTRFYQLLDALEHHHHGKRLLLNCKASTGWPPRGVYFLFEPGEHRTDTGTSQRVVRVGTHAVSTGAKANLWSRLRAHYGDDKDGGNHRASIFRKLVGEAWLQQTSSLVPSWGIGSSLSCGDPIPEGPIEQKVSLLVRQMSVLWFAVDDPPSPTSMRSIIEQNATSLLSNYSHPSSPIDLPSHFWLGRSSPRERVQLSGLWNQDFVNQPYDTSFLGQMDTLVEHHIHTVKTVGEPVAKPSQLSKLLSLVRSRTCDGDEISTLSQHKRNRIAGVDDEGIDVLTDRSTAPSRVEWSWIEDALAELLQQGSLTQSEIPGRGRYRSAFVLALIARKLPEYVTVTQDGIEYLALHPSVDLYCPTSTVSPNGPSPPCVTAQSVG